MEAHATQQLRSWLDGAMREPPPADEADDEGGPILRALRGATFQAFREETPPPPPDFSPFNEDQMEAAIAVAAKLMEASSSLAGESAGALHRRLQGAIKREAEAAAEQHGWGVVRFALRLFRTHDPRGKALGPIEPLEERAPLRMLPSTSATDAIAEDTETDPEMRLAWFREDPALNEHHEQWHTVYPFPGIEMHGHTVQRDRQGELFLYMHQQMLARYDTERVAVGLDLLKPLDDYDAPIPEGFDPNPTLPPGLPPIWRDNRRPRPAGVRLNESAFGRLGVLRMKAARALLEACIAEGKVPSTTGWYGTNQLDIDRLGAVIEASVGAGRPSYPLRALSLHNTGHNVIASLGPGPDLDDPDIRFLRRGVMADTDTALRDPIFYRWHRHIDGFSVRWQESEGPYSFDESTPRGVTIRSRVKGHRGSNSPDVFLVDAQRLPERLRPPIGGDAGAWFEAKRVVLDRWARRAFGGDNWDRDPSKLEGVTDTLHTRMVEHVIKFDPKRYRKVDPIPIQTLDHDDFAFVVRVSNSERSPTELTLRLWMCAEKLVNDRRMWIELDKFRHRASPGASVAIRPATSSAVILKPARRYNVDQDNGRGTVSGEPDGYCNCGWPYTLLIPRGTSDGFKCKLFVIATPWGQDAVGSTKCGSLSFCGSVDIYPDRREMGFPFNRPFDGTPQDALTLENMGMRSFRIVHDG